MCGNNLGRQSSKQVYLLNSRNRWEKHSEIDGFVLSGRGSFVDLNDYKLSHPFWETGEKQQQNPGSLLNDYWYFDADTTSHDNSPEHEITWVNEYIDNPAEWYENQEEQYNNLGYAGIICQSSTEISNFSSFSAYFKKGINITKLLGGDKFGPSNNFAEIANSLLANRRFGVGEVIGNNSIDTERMIESAKFCEANGFYWDGIIAEETNVREFLFTQAAYQLLDFTIIGGRFSLMPSVPVDSNFKILNSAKAGSNEFPIKALFTDGNVQEFKTTFLSPEERQLFIAEIKYRIEPETNGFPDQRSLRVHLSPEQGGYFRDPVESFDLTQFCTSREHALTFAKYALRIRQLVDHAVSFQTTPDAAHNLAPGDYIRIAVSVQHQERDRGYTRRLVTGSISDNGIVQTSRIGYKGQEVYYWRPGTTDVKTATLPDSGMVEDNEELKGVLFTVKSTVSESRIYKVESIAFSEESFVDISATYIPVEQDGTMSTLKWDDADFVIEDQYDE